MFAKNTENLLQQRPVRGARIIALDPGYRTGCKVAVLDEYGKLLDHTTVYPTPPRSQVKETQAQLAAYVEKHRINVIVIGNGTGSRETEEVVADYIARSKAPVRYTIVNEAGASVYSASKLASEEYPDLDVTTRGAMSLGRRLQDPLAELVKIPPQAIGVGQYQHDLNQAALERALTGVVENVVNRVGVDLNTASASLLGYVSGISAAVAKNIVAYREEHGAFTDRGQLKKVPKLGAKAFQNCAGFLRISDGKNPLDATSVHPESYAVANELLKRAKVKPEALADGGVPDFASRLGDVDALAAELARSYRGAGVPCCVLVSDRDGAAFVAAEGIPAADVVCCDAPGVADALGGWLVGSLPDLAEALGASFACCRRAEAHRVVLEAARNNALVGSLAFLKEADMPVMMATEIAMMYKVAHTYGLPLDAARLKEVGAIVASSFALRGAARAAVRLLPLPAFLVKAAVAAAGTYGVGRGLVAYYDAVACGPAPVAAEVVEAAASDGAVV